VECTVNRVGDDFFDQIERSGHAMRDSDLDRIASLGVSACRYPALWERVAPESLDKPDWSWLDRRLPRLRDLGVQPIAGLVHHGSGPRYTSLIDPDFPAKLARYAGMVAERFPWLDAYTPVNELLTTARFAGLYGLWYPHGRDDETFLRCLLNECKGTALAMREIRKVNPDAKLIQTEDLGNIHSTRALHYQRDFENERRWLSWDLLCGRVDREHALWDYLIGGGASPQDLEWFLEHPSPPDMLGVNYYVTSERFLDDDFEQYPPATVGGNGRHTYADIEAVRVRREGLVGVAQMVTEAWERYSIPVAITEAHIGCTREEQLRWFNTAWKDAHRARDAGVDIRAVTVWSLFGSYNWNCLLTRDDSCYESGVFDLRAPEPRETGLAKLIRRLAGGEEPADPALQQPGWWDRDIRFEYIPQGKSTFSRPLVPTSPLVITGASGTLGRAFARICEMRGLHYRLLSRQDMDITNVDSVCDTLTALAPWAVINAAGYVRVDDAEVEIDRCMAENAKGPAILAEVCSDQNARLVTFSSDLVFDGEKGAPYVEDDPTGPLSVYGRSKAAAERMLGVRNAHALIIRTAAFFSPWDPHHFVHHVLRTLGQGQVVHVDDGGVVSPTYVPDLVNASLDLLLDDAQGICHLTNEGEMTWAEFARMAARMAGLDAGLVRTGRSDSARAPRPGYSALGSSKAWIMPDLENAMGRYMRLANLERRSVAYAS
jgi:dTDP-4-dehydrorhamnose reductase